MKGVEPNRPARESRYPASYTFHIAFLRWQGIEPLSLYVIRNHRAKVYDLLKEKPLLCFHVAIIHQIELNVNNYFH